MKRLKTIKHTAANAIIMVAALAMTSLSMAQVRGDNYERRDDRRGGPVAQRGAPPLHADDRRDSAGSNHDLRRGGRLPDEYRSRQYVVDDWRGHHLTAPPRGYRWVQAGSDYVLAAIATGIIANVLINH